tara:strand:- start:80 stop:301 length:222 start_codon:yes stop_codon:yes gene_type:complete
MGNYNNDIRVGGRPQPITQEIGQVQNNVRKTLLNDAPIQEKQVIDDSTLVSNDTNVIGGLKVILILWAVMEYC